MARGATSSSSASVFISISAAVALTFVSGCKSSTSKFQRPPSQIHESDTYRIGPEDVLDVSIWGEDAIGATLPVRPDGRISIPLAGEIRAAGLTPKELEKEIGLRLEPYVQDSPVTVVVREVNHTRFYVLVEVARPGAYPMRGGRIGLLQGLAVAGGLGEFADRSSILIIRHTADGKEQRYRVDYDELVDTGGADVYLSPGDTVVVP